jgi:hypothetical protein
MNLQFVHANVVITASQFNPSVISQLWLVKNGVVGETDFQDGCVFSPMLVQVQASAFALLVIPDQLQFAPREPSDLEQDLVVEKVGRITTTLPHTPFAAIGLNFVCHATPQKTQFGTLTRNLFFREDNPLFEEFATDDARFGGYMSKNVFECRLKLDIKPLTAKPKGESTEVLQFAFNFHRDLSPEHAIAEIDQVLKRWTEAKGLAKNLLERIEAWRDF